MLSSVLRVCDVRKVEVREIVDVSAQISLEGGAVCCGAELVTDASIGVAELFALTYVPADLRPGASL